MRAIEDMGNSTSHQHRQRQVDLRSGPVDALAEVPSSTVEGVSLLQPSRCWRFFIEAMQQAMKWLSSCAYVPVAEDGGLEDASSREGSEDEGDEDEEEEEEDSETDMLSGDGTDEEDGNAEGSRTYFVPIGMASPTFSVLLGKNATHAFTMHICAVGALRMQRRVRLENQLSQLQAVPEEPAPLHDHIAHLLTFHTSPRHQRRMVHLLSPGRAWHERMFACNSPSRDICACHVV